MLRPGRARRFENRGASPKRGVRGRVLFGLGAGGRVGFGQAPVRICKLGVAGRVSVLLVRTTQAHAVPDFICDLILERNGQNELKEPECPVCLACHGLVRCVSSGSQDSPGRLSFAFSIQSPSD